MYTTFVVPLLTLAALTAAQTSTSCNPLTATCPADNGLAQSTYSTNFLNGADARWVPAAGTTVSYGGQGLELTVRSATTAPVMQTDFYIFFGYVEAKIRAAPGVGLVSSLVLLSDDLDEIDWEWLGGRTDAVQTNYFGKGNITTYDRATWEGTGSPTTEFHTYGIDWKADSITWVIDGRAVRTLNYADAVGGRNFPQTPSRISLGLWAGGASSAPGTVEWAGGPTDFSQGPFTMYIESVSITNYNPASTYSFGDNSGSYQSIRINGGGAFNSGGSGGSGNSGSADIPSNPLSSSAVAAVPSSAEPTTTSVPPPPAPSPTTTTTTTTTLPTTVTTSTTVRTTTTITPTTTTTTTTTTSTTTSARVSSSSSPTISTTSSAARTTTPAAASSSVAPNAAATHFDLSWISSMLVCLMGLGAGVALL